MTDYALNKNVLEYCNHGGFLTDGKTDKYNGVTGYLGIHAPSYVTVDLQDIKEVKNICFKLWDYEDKDNECPDKAQLKDKLYTYRLLISTDKMEWKVVYDCSKLQKDKYKKGWQTFVWEQPVPVRFIRVHCMNSKRGSGFHIVELHAYDQVARLRKVDTEISFDANHTFDVEIGDAYPLSYQLYDLSGRFQDALEKRVAGKPNAKEIYDSIIDFLFRKGREVESVNGKIDEIRRLVSDPVKDGIQRRFKEENIESRKNIWFSIFQLAAWLILFIVSIILHA